MNNITIAEAMRLLGALPGDTHQQLRQRLRSHPDPDTVQHAYLLLRDLPDPLPSPRRWERRRRDVFAEVAYEWHAKPPRPPKPPWQPKPRQPRSSAVAGFACYFAIKALLLVGIFLLGPALPSNGLV